MTDGITCLKVGEGPRNIVFLHGIGADAFSFHHQMPFPKARATAWNMPGYQGSKFEMPPTFDHLSDVLFDFIGERQSVHLVGQSIGGMIALHHALRFPKQVLSLTLIATTSRFGGRDESFKQAFLKARLGALDNGATMADIAAKSAPHLVGPNTAPDEIKHIEKALAAVPEPTWRRILNCLVTFDRADDLDQVECPTLMVAGSVDQNAPAKTMGKMAAKIPNARFHSMEGAGHMPHQENPKLFNTLLNDFLDEVTK
ncbi:MAG: alpha/beta fold hydrolase [Planktomarina sp.]